MCLCVCVYTPSHISIFLSAVSLKEEKENKEQNTSSKAHQQLLLRPPWSPSLPFIFQTWLSLHSRHCILQLLLSLLSQSHVQALHTRCPRVSLWLFLIFARDHPLVTSHRLRALNTLPVSEHQRMLAPHTAPHAVSPWRFILFLVCACVCICVEGMCMRVQVPMKARRGGWITWSWS